MPKLIDVEGVGVQEFPDDATDQEIGAALNKAYPPSKESLGFKDLSAGQEPVITQPPKPLIQTTYDRPPEQRQEEFVQKSLEPPVPLPTAKITKETSVPAALAKETYNVVKSVPEFAETPAGIISAFAGAVAPIPTALGFAAMGGKQMYEQIPSLLKKKPGRTSGEYAAEVVDVLGSAAMTGLPLMGLRRLISKNASTLPLAAKAAAAEVGEPIPKTKGVPDASSQRETEEVYGDLFSQPEQGAGQVPTQVGGAGVQPQAAEVPQEGQARVLSVKDIALEAQRKAGWDPKWPFVPADFGNKTFREAIEVDPGISAAEKDKMFAAAEKLLGGKIDRTQTATPPVDVPAAQSAAAGAAVEPTVVPPEIPRKPISSNLKSGLKMFHAETEINGDDILSWLQENAKILSKSAARRLWGKEKFQESSSDWDDSVKLQKPHHNAIYSDNGRAPSTVADDAYKAGRIKEPTARALWAAIDAASKKRANAFRTARRQRAEIEAQEKETIAAEKLSHDDQAHIDAERGNVSAPIEISPIEPSPDTTFARDIATIDRDRGVIVINPKNYRIWLNRRPLEMRRQMVRSLVNEEDLHLKVDDESARTYFENLSRPEQSIAIRRYAGKGLWRLAEAGLDPTMAGHEALRYRLQQLNRMTPRELAEAVGREKWTIRGLDAAEGAIRTLRETLGTKASQEQLAILARMAQNAGIARSVISGQPAARLKDRKETSAQEVMFLPPPPKGEALERGSGLPDPTAAQIESLADSHIASDVERGQLPSFNRFREDTGIKRERVWYPWQDALNKKLMGASGAEIERLVEAAGLRRDIAKALKPGESDPTITRHAFADPPIHPKPEEFNLAAARKLAKKPLDPRLKARYAAIAGIKDKLSAEAGKAPEKPWERPSIGPEDVDQKYVVNEAVSDPMKIEEQPWEVQTDRQFRTLTADERTNAAKFADLATKGAAVEASGKGAPPRTVTRNVVALKDRSTGKIVMVSAWRDPRTGPKVTNPLSRSDAGMFINDNLLKKFEPMAVIGLRDPVKDFRQTFENQAEFDKYWGDLAISGTPGIKTGSFAGPQAGVIETQAGIRGAGSPSPAQAGLPPELTAPATPAGEGISAPREIIARERQHPIQTGSMLYRMPRPSPEPAQRLSPEAQAALGRTAEPAPTEIPSPPLREVLGGLGRPTGAIRTVGKPAQMGPGWPLRAGLQREGMGATGRRAPAARLKEDIAEVGEDISFNFHAAVDAVRDMVGKGEIDRLLPRTIDHADNRTHIDAEAIGNYVRTIAAKGLAGVGPIKAFLHRIGQTSLVRGDPEVLRGANPMVESGLNLGRVAAFKQSVLRGMQKAKEMADSPNWKRRKIGKAWIRQQEDYLKEISYAEQHWHDPRLRETAAAAKAGLDEIIAMEKQAGSDIRKEPNYLPHRWDASLWDGNRVLFPKLQITGKEYRAERTFPDHYTASEHGPYIAATRDIASLVSHRYRQGLHRLYQEAWLQSLTEVRMPDGKPLGLREETVKKGLASAADYEPVLVNRSMIYVHKGAASLVRNLTSRSQVEDWALTRNALHLSQVLKHSLLIGDFFHMGRVLYYGTSLMGRKMGFEGGLSALDYRPQDLAEAVRKGIIRPEDAKWATGLVDFDGQAVTRQELLKKFTGANIGKIQDALYKDLLTNLSPVAGKIHRITQRVTDPSVGRYNRFLFDKLTRGVMAESLVNQYEALHKAHPQIPSQRLAEDIARDVNNFFGNLGRQGALKSATMRDVARLFTLAPQWVEGLARKEASFMGRATGISKGLDALGIGDRKGLPMLGATGKGVGAGLLFMFGLTQAINLINRRQFTWQNEEKEHKFDAYLKSFGGNKEGFWLSPMAIWNELAHDVFRFAMTKPTFADAVFQVAGNKASPIFRALSVAASGKTGAGLQTTSTGERMAEAGKSLIPVPITFGRYMQAAGHALAPGSVSPVPPGQIERQTFGAMGVKVEPESSAVSEVSRMAKDWMKKEGLDKSTGWTQTETTDPSYGKLRMAIRNGDERVAVKMLEGLRRNHSDAQISKAMEQWSKKGFTTKAHEGASIDSLSPKQQEMYYQAMDSKQELLEKYYDFLDRH